MAATTPLSGARYPNTGDSFVPDQDIRNAVLDIESMLIPRFTTTSTRDGAYTAWATATGKTLVDGLYCHVTSTGCRYRYDSAAGGWVIDGGRSQFQTLIVNGGWTVPSGHTPRGYMTSAGVHLVGWFTNGGAFTVNATQTPISLPASLQNPATNQVLMIPYATSAQGEGIVICTLLTTGTLRMDYLLAGGPTPIPAGSNFFLDSISYHPTYAG